VAAEAAHEGIVVNGIAPSLNPDGDTAKTVSPKQEIVGTKSKIPFPSVKRKQPFSR
jgi:hypothetical protein